MENWRDYYTHLMGIITGKHYQNSAEAFYAFPYITPNELLQHSNSDAKPGECSIFTAEAGMSSRWVEPSESYWLQAKAVPWQALEGYPNFPALPHSLVSTGLGIPPKQLETVPTPTAFWSPSHHWNPKGELLLSSLMPDKSTWDFHGYQSRLHLLCCIFSFCNEILHSAMLKNLLWRVKNFPI